MTQATPSIWDTPFKKGYFGSLDAAKRGTALSEFFEESLHAVRRELSEAYDARVVSGNYYTKLRNILENSWKGKNFLQDLQSDAQLAQSKDRVLRAVSKVSAALAAARGAA